MNKPSKKRLCWNCEGSVSLEAETCPYCGVSVVPATLENVNVGFMPSYRMGEVQDSAIPRSPYEDDEAEPGQQEPGQEISKELEEDEPAFDEFQRTLLATVLLLTGSVFFLFGLALMLFSHNGVLSLQWDSSLWFVYTALAVPLLFFGGRYLSKLD